VHSAYTTNWKLKSANPDIYVQSLSELTAHFGAAETSSES
jgi:hypothetical protein